MVELTNMQQILSMSSGPEKIQQVQQQQPDTQGRQFAAEFRQVADTQKNQVKEATPGSESHLVEDRKEYLGGQQRGKGKKRGSAVSGETTEKEARVEEVNQGKIVDIKV